MGTGCGKVWGNCGVATIRCRVLLAKIPPLVDKWGAHKALRGIADQYSTYNLFIRIRALPQDGEYDMAQLTIHGGDFGKHTAHICYCLFKGRCIRIGRGLFRKPVFIRLKHEVASVQIIDAAQFKDGGGGIVGALIGRVLLGGAGMVAGAILGGNRRKISFICFLHNGRRFVATTDRRIFDRFLIQFVGMTPPIPSGG